MITLKGIFEVFSHSSQYGRLASQSRKAMERVILRKHGREDIASLSAEDISAWLDAEQDREARVKAHSCMFYLWAWATTMGKKFPTVAPVGVKEQRAEPEPKPKPKAEPRPKSKPKPKPKPKPEPVNSKETEARALTEHPTKWTGYIYHDESSGGWKNGKRIFKDCWRVEIMIDNVRYRHRSIMREDCEEWLKAVRQGKIKPTDNKADWMRMEQSKDVNVRRDEVIVSAAEEAMLMYGYHQTGDIVPICHYIAVRLLPHLTYYCGRTLRLTKEASLNYTKQAAALLLTRITSGQPVPNFTAACKRMLRVRRAHKDFWYYEKAPTDVQHLVDGLDFSQLAKVWKVTRDRRI